jgi:Rho termination factor, N-terminal domain
MPKAWSGKRERQYEHVKESEKKQGRSTKRAKEIAARTVNKQRAQKGETKGSSRGRSTSSSRSSSSRGSSSSSNGAQTKEQLYQQAKRLGIEGRSRMNKQQLQRAVSRRK